MAAAASGAPMGTPDTYFSKYSAAEDVLNGDYMQLYTRHATTSASTPTELLERLATALELIPKVFLAMVLLSTGDPVVMPVFRITKYVPHVLNNSSWDDKDYAFTGDVEVNNFINIVEVQADAFKCTPQCSIHSMATIDGAIAAQAGQAMLDAVPDGSVGSDKIRSRFMVQVPHTDIPLVFNQTMSPVEACETLKAAIISNGNEIACDYLLDWLRLSMTLTPGLTAGDATGPLAIHLGSLVTAFPVLGVDSALSAFWWSMLRADLPILDRSGFATSEPLLHVLREMRYERKDQMQKEEEHRALSKADKLPSEAFPATTKNGCNSPWSIGRETHQSCTNSGQTVSNMRDERCLRTRFWRGQDMKGPPLVLN